MIQRRKATTPIGRRLRLLREMKNLSQGDIEDKTGLLRCYISRVENGHTVPSLETLQRFSNGLDVPLYEVFYTEEEVGDGDSSDGKQTGRGGRAGADDKLFLKRLRDLAPRLSKEDQEVLLSLARKLAGK
jgi:transcriptional regulator with XRE-family HTH domain